MLETHWTITVVMDAGNVQFGRQSLGQKSLIFKGILVVGARGWDLLGVPPRPFGAALRVLAPPEASAFWHLGTRHNASLSTYPTGVIPPPLRGARLLAVPQPSRGSEGLVVSERVGLLGATRLAPSGPPSGC